MIRGNLVQIWEKNIKFYVCYDKRKFTSVINTTDINLGLSQLCLMYNRRNFCAC